MQDITLTPSDFVALLNQTLDLAYPIVVIEGELANFRVKNNWVYFDLKDDDSKVAFFGSVYQLPGPLQDGMSIRVVGAPRLHQRFGFSVNFRSISAVGEGSIKKAADLLAAKLEAEGLFAAERKRPLPQIPTSIGLITGASSAAYADFIKILNERWGGVTVTVAEVMVQGDQAPMQLVGALEHFNQLPLPPEVIALVRGGGSAEDLAAFSDERVVRAVAASRVPTIVAIGHEVDISLAELAADQRASTPSDAAACIVPDRTHHLQVLIRERAVLQGNLLSIYSAHRQRLDDWSQALRGFMNELLRSEQTRLRAARDVLGLLDPKAVLKRGYALVSKGEKIVTRAAQVKIGDKLLLTFSDGKIQTTAEGASDG